MNEEPKRHWIDNVADVISGRVNNTLEALAEKCEALNRRNALLMNTVIDMENEMTDNEQKIENAVASLKADRQAITSAFDALKAKIEATPAAEDLSQELADLEAAVGGIHETAQALTAPVAAEPILAENHDPAGVADPTIDHTNNPPIPLAGDSGATDAGAPTQVPPPGAPITDPVTTPVATTDETGDEGGDTEDDNDEDDFDTAPPTPTPTPDPAPPVEVAAPSPDVTVEQALPETQEPALPDAPPVSDPEFVATDPVTGEPLPKADTPTHDSNW